MNERRPSVALVIHKDGPGGGPVSLGTHVRHLRTVYQLTVIHGGRGSVAATCENLGVTHHRLPIERPMLWTWGVPMLTMYLKRIAPELLVLFGQWGGAIGALAGRLAGIRRIVYVAQWSAFYADWDLYRVIRNYICERIPCRLSNLVISLSPSNRYQYLYRRMVPEERLIYLPNPVEHMEKLCSDSGEEIRRTLGWNPDHCHVVSVGRLADQKRVDWLLASWKLVQEQMPSAKLWIVGGGKEEAMLRRMASALGIEGTCQFLGAKPNGTDYLAAADVVVVTSLFETFGRVPVEAMACGKPVVASKVDGICDTIRDGCEGFLVPPGDIPAFAARIIELVRSPVLRRKMGEAGRKRAHKYSAEIVTAAYRKLFDSLIEKKDPDFIVAANEISRNYERESE